MVVHWNPIDDALQYSLTVTPHIGEMILPKSAQSVLVDGLHPSVSELKIFESFLSQFFMFYSRKLKISSFARFGATRGR